jgi:hypothetical protein
MNFGVFIPIVAILASAWVAVTFLHYQHRRSLAGKAGAGTPSVEEARENARLAHENEVLKLTIDRLEERLSVLERIATDPAERTAREIESLRHGS